MSLVIKESAILDILKREIPKLFSEEAHEKFDFENLTLLMTNKKETIIHKDSLVFVDVKEKKGKNLIQRLDEMREPEVLEQPPKTTEFLMISEHGISERYQTSFKISRDSVRGKAYTFPVNELTTVEQMFRHVLENTRNGSILRITCKKD